MCSSLSAHPGSPRGLEVLCWPCLFHTGENIVFPWLQCWGFHGKKSPAGCVCISRPEIASQFPRRCYSLHTYCCMYSHTHCASQARAKIDPKQKSVWTRHARRHGMWKGKLICSRFLFHWYFTFFFFSSKIDDCVHLFCGDTKPTWDGNLPNLTNYISSFCSSQWKKLFLKIVTFFPPLLLFHVKK